MGTAAPQSGWAADGPGIGLVLVLGPGVGAGEKEVGVGAQCAEQAGHGFFLGSWVEALVGTAGGRARRNRDGQWIEDGLGAGVEAPRRRSEVEAGAEAGAAAIFSRERKNDEHVPCLKCIKTRWH